MENEIKNTLLTLHQIICDYEKDPENIDFEKMQKVYERMRNECLQAYKNGDMDTLQNLLYEQHKTMRMLGKALYDCDHQAAVMAGKMLQTCVLFELLTKEEYTDKEVDALG